jgi:chromosomal replication initiator protein
MERILAALQERIGPQKFNAWFRHGTHLSVEDGHVRVSVPNPFVANWIETHYRTDIAAATQTQTGKVPTVVVTIDPTLTGELRKHQLDSQADIVAKATQGRSRPRRPVQPPQLRHKLEEFVVGSSNKLAYSSALIVASGENAPFNPLFIHGACGVGKTHLLQGICNKFCRVRRGTGAAAWRYVTAEQFTNEFISSMRQKKLDTFRARFRRLDLLAIDDVHFLSAKKATQDEFLHTYNAIESAGKRVVMASDAHPHLVGELSQQLASRFVAGMVVKIDPPDQSTRMEILRRKARTLSLKAPQEVLQYIAMHIRGSVRELEGTLVKFAALAALNGGRITLELATEALADHLARTDSAITVGDIEAAVAIYFGIAPADLHSTRRTRTVSVARMVAMFLARRHTQMSFPEIGRFMGKNHSSVVLACQRMESLLSSGGQLKWTGPLGSKSAPAAKLVELLTEQFS